MNSRLLKLICSLVVALALVISTISNISVGYDDYVAAPQCVDEDGFILQ